MGGSIIDQGKIDLYYEMKKDEVSGWLIEYTADLKRLKEEQRKRILAYARALSFKSIDEVNEYVQHLPTVSKKDKKRIEKYLQSVDWLPEGVTVGFLDGQLVVKMLPNTQAEEMIREAFGPEEEGDSDSDNRNGPDAET